MKLAATVIYVDDVPRILRFYREAFGFETKFLDADVQLPGRVVGEKYQFSELAVQGGALQLGTHALGSLLMPGFPRSATGEPSGCELAFYTPDVPGAFERAVRAGAHAIRPPERMPWGQTVAYVRSLEGTFIGLCTPLDASAPS